jgi:N-acetylglucosamine kinase-like BadF-type ATPase
VLAAAAGGDAVARAIVHYAAEELAGLALHLRGRIGDQPLVAVTGSLMRQPALREAFDARLRTDGIATAPGEADAVAGALRIAARQARGA